MSNDESPDAVYAGEIAAEQTRLGGLRRWHRTVVWARIANLVLLVVLAGQACSREHGRVPEALASAALFIALSIVIALLEHRIARRTSYVRYYEAGQKRARGHAWEGATDGARFIDPAHPYAADLDIFGSASVFSLLCAARTGTGQATLARWLLQPASTDVIERRQHAVRQLASQLFLRRDLYLAGGKLQKQVREEELEAWLLAKAAPVGTSRRIAVATLGALGLFALYAFVEPRFLGIAAAIVLVQRVVASRFRTLTQSVQSGVFERAWELKVIARVARLLEQQRFSDPHLVALVSGISDGGQPASKHIARLVRLVDWLESRRNPMFVVFAVALLLPEQLAFAIEGWRARHGAAAARWLAAIGEMEALASLATFSFEHPAYSFPEMVAQADGPSVTATALGHPLIPADVRVTNDVQLQATCPLLVVTGSNMSGKSTLLRTVGVNVALAQAGAPVCASRMLLSPLELGASLRAQDSLEQGVSRFFAEIKRLHAILSLAADKPVLFLLDEILNGTNSIDRRDGAETVVRQLLGRGAIGLITTHDLALSALADAPHIHGANIHFEDRIEGDRLIFDYRIRPGIVTRRNALDLMRMIGIDVAIEKRPPGFAAE